MQRKRKNSYDSLDEQYYDEGSEESEPEASEDNDGSDPEYQNAAEEEVFFEDIFHPDIEFIYASKKDPETQENLYLVKFKGRAHIHC